jgi:hypothetical protein
MRKEIHERKWPATDRICQRLNKNLSGEKQQLEQTGAPVVNRKIHAENGPKPRR